MDEQRRPGEKLDPPAAFTASYRAGQPRLMPPSHFESRLLPGPESSLKGVWSAAAVGDKPWATMGRADKDIQQPNQTSKNQYPRKVHGKSDGEDAERGHGLTDQEEFGARARSLDRVCEDEQAVRRHAMDILKQAEIISQQIRDIHRLEAESSGLRALSSQQAARLNEQEDNLGRLHEELKGLRSQLACTEAQKSIEVEKTSLTCKAELERFQLQAQLELVRLQAQLSQERDQAQAEIKDLRRELKTHAEGHQNEVAALSAELKRTVEERERGQLKQEEHLQKQLQEAERKLQTQLLAATEAHGDEVASLQRSKLVLEEELQRVQKQGHQEVTQLQDELLASKQERATLGEELRKARSDLDSQNIVVQQLRTYIGELVPDNHRTEEWRQEREHFVDTVQLLENDRASLRTTTELLNVRLSALTDILSLQELELGKKAQNSGEDVTNTGHPHLLTCWRKKVFALMVQLKSQEINHENDARQVCSKISELQDELESSNQKHSVLLHSLQDKTAQLDMEKISHQALQQDLDRTRAVATYGKQRAERAEEALHHFEGVVGSFHKVFMAQESQLKSALLHLGSLGQRLCFAAKRVDTIQGMVARKIAIIGLQMEDESRASRAALDSSQPSYKELQEEVGLLHLERDRLSAELKLSAQMITKKVSEARDKACAEMRDQQEVISQLQEALEEKTRYDQELEKRLHKLQEQREAELHDLKQRLTGAEGKLQESGKRLEEQNKHMAGLQEEYQTAIQEKVSEVEAGMLQQLSEMEKRVNDARREHTKAVVALRQAERQTARDKERTQETVKLHQDAHQQETQRLYQQIHKLERDRNLLMATLKQEGLLKQHMNFRLPAHQSTDNLNGEEQTDRPQTPLLPEAQPLSKGGADRNASVPVLQAVESLSAMLDNLQALSTAIINEEGEVLTEEEDN